MESKEELYQPELTKEQLKIAKKFKKVFQEAVKAHIHIWDDYGTLSMVNGNYFASLLNSIPGVMAFDVSSDYDGEFEDKYNFDVGSFNGGLTDDTRYYKLTDEAKQFLWEQEDR